MTIHVYTNTNTHTQTQLIRTQTHIRIGILVCVDQPLCNYDDLENKPSSLQKDSVGTVPHPTGKLAVAFEIQKYSVNKSGEAVRNSTIGHGLKTIQTIYTHIFRES